MKLIANLGVLLAATIGSASAGMITYNTSGSAFTCAGCSSVNNAGATPTITIIQGLDTVTILYTGPGPGPTNVTVTPNPTSNVSYGLFALQCVVCVSPSDVINIPAFTFALLVNNVTDSTTATFNGSSAAGTVTANSSNIGVTWSPLTLPDGTAVFTITSPTLLPSDNTLAGQASIQGTVTMPTMAPEPGSMFLLGAGLIGVGFAARKKFVGRS